MNFSLAVFVLMYGALAAGVAATFRRGFDKGLSWVRWYLLIIIGCNTCQSLFLREFGYRSHQYAFAYYATDIGMTILGFLLLARLVEVAFEKSSLKLPRLRLIATILFTGVTVGSAAVVYLSRGSLTTGRVGAALDQNFSFLGMVLAIILFVAMNAMFVQGVRFRRTVLSFSIMYSASAIIYSLEQLMPKGAAEMEAYAMPLISVGTIALLAYALWVPEKRREEWVERRRRMALAEGRA